MAIKEKTEFESRIEFRPVKLYGYKNRCFEASVFWNGQLHETLKASKERCTAELKKMAAIKE